MDSTMDNIVLTDDMSIKNISILLIGILVGISILVYTIVFSLMENFSGSQIYSLFAVLLVLTYIGALFYWFSTWFAIKVDLTSEKILIEHYWPGSKNIILQFDEIDILEIVSEKRYLTDYGDCFFHYVNILQKNGDKISKKLNQYPVKILEMKIGKIKIIEKNIKNE